MIAVFKPYCPARTAAEYPPGPLPMIIRSYVILLLHLNNKPAANLFEAARNFRPVSKPFKWLVLAFPGEMWQVPAAELRNA